MSFFSTSNIINIPDDRKRGEEVLRIFWISSKSKYPIEFKWTLEELFSEIDKQSKSVISGLGLGVKLSDINDSRIKDAMTKVAELSDGKIPKNPQIFLQALSDRVQEFDLQGFGEVALEAAKDTAKLAEQGVKIATLGAGVYGLVKLLAVIIPVIMLLKQKGSK